MHQVPASVWNAIAKTQELRNPSFRQLMSLPEQQMLKALDELAVKDNDKALARRVKQQRSQMKA